ncbi:MAG TPA: hypothetical protein VGK90_11535 [Rhizomicrobium sp.]
MRFVGMTGDSTHVPQSEFVAEAWHWLAIILPLILAVLGICESLFPPNTIETKVGSIVLFVLLGFAAAIAIHEDQRTTKRNHSRLMKAITGGDAFCIFTVDLGMSMRTDVPCFPFIATASGPLQEVNYWISPASANLNASDDAYFSVWLNLPSLQTIHEGTRRWWGGLPLGDFYIEFDAINGMRQWVERICIAVLNGQYVQAVEVRNRKTNKIVWQEIPDGFEWPPTP